MNTPPVEAPAETSDDVMLNEVKRLVLIRRRLAHRSDLLTVCDRRGARCWHRYGNFRDGSAITPVVSQIRSPSC